MLVSGKCDIVTQIVRIVSAVRILKCMGSVRKRTKRVRAALTSHTKASEVPWANLHWSITLYSIFLSLLCPVQHWFFTCWMFRGKNCIPLASNSPPHSWVATCMASLGLFAAAISLWRFFADSAVRKNGRLVCEFPCGFTFTSTGGPSNQYCTITCLYMFWCPPQSEMWRTHPYQLVHTHTQNPSYSFHKHTVVSLGPHMQPSASAKGHLFK